jgi:SAM-dependent methyltransferase
MSTDLAWEQWGQRDPYFGVLTHPRFRSANLTDEARAEFFALGQLQADHVLQGCRRLLDPHFQPQRVLDFGCGVGRVVLPFARIATEVVGVDISPAMLAETRRNCERENLGNVNLVLSDDTLSRVQGQFDLVHSCIVIQHIDIARGLVLFERLVRLVKPSGLGVLHVAFAWDAYRGNQGVKPPPPPVPWWRQGLKAVAGALPGRTTQAVPPPVPGQDPEMQMNFHNMSQLMFILQQAGVSWVHAELTDHGGAIGAFLYFAAPPATAPAAPAETSASN